MKQVSESYAQLENSYQARPWVQLAHQNAPWPNRIEFRNAMYVGIQTDRLTHWLAGEELFISYGASEWFTDRGLISEVAKAAESTAEFGGPEEKILNPRLTWRHTSICKCLVPHLKSSIFINFLELSSFQSSAFELKLLRKTESLSCCILHLLGHKKVSYGHIVMVSGPQVEGTARLSLLAGLQVNEVFHFPEALCKRHNTPAICTARAYCTGTLSVAKCIYVH